MGCNTFALSAYIAFCRVATPVWHTFDQCSISSYLEAFSSQGKYAEVNIWKVLGRQKPLAQLKLLRRGTKDLQSYSYARMTAQIEIEVCSCMAWRACHGFSSVRLFVVQNRARCPPFVHSWKSTTWGGYPLLFNSSCFFAFLWFVNKQWQWGFTFKRGAIGNATIFNEFSEVITETCG